ncbi:MAG: tRNA preQ1(34) S-adenosylmethionine ribosyltransferase-isomerase QueA [Armatimonadetes bacterium]|nr:tRNA preQ1(34) S-adenosylmethionine ribosyltransferase-isomerase QueA [Armatimonadota bacterium]
MERTTDYEYELPPSLIAQRPVARGASRLMVLDRDTGELRLESFGALPRYLRSGDVLVLNDTRVSARRLTATLPSGRRGEALLLRPRGLLEWEALVCPGKSMRSGTVLSLEAGHAQPVVATVVERTSEGGRVLRLGSATIRDALGAAGATPLPPYIHETLDDEGRYQTVYAAQPGSAAAPTAGLHFTEELLASLENLGVQVARITLHVGVDTFRPVRDDDPERHVMHGEWYSMPPADADLINACRGRVVAVGTTVVRALESAATPEGTVRAGSAVTRLFIRPGYVYRVVDALVTNFHLPRSTLLMLVSALAGREAVLSAYRRAVEERMRFYSFGDAMLIIGAAGRIRS